MERHTYKKRVGIIKHLILIEQMRCKKGGLLFDYKIGQGVRNEKSCIFLIKEFVLLRFRDRPKQD